MCAVFIVFADVVACATLIEGNVCLKDVRRAFFLIAYFHVDASVFSTILECEEVASAGVLCVEVVAFVDVIFVVIVGIELFDGFFVSFVFD